MMAITPVFRTENRGATASGAAVDAAGGRGMVAVWLGSGSHDGRKPSYRSLMASCDTLAGASSKAMTPLRRPSRRSAIAPCKLWLVQHAQHRHALLGGEVAQQAHHLLGGFGVEAGHRLIGQQGAWALGQSAGDGGALRLAAGQSAGALLGELASARPGPGSSWRGGIRAREGRRRR